MYLSESKLTKFNAFNWDTVNGNGILDWFVGFCAVSVFIFSLLKGGVSAESIINTISTPAVFASVIFTLSVVLGIKTIGSFIGLARERMQVKQDKQGGLPTRNSFFDYVQLFLMLSFILLLLPIGESSFIQKALVGIVHFMASYPI